MTPPKQLRSLCVLALALGLLLLTSAGSAAPSAKLLRVDPRAAIENGSPVLTTVIDVAQSKRISDAVRSCGALRGDAQLDCMSEALEKKYALYSPFNFPEENALFAVNVDGADRPAKLLSHARWGESQQKPGVGTAWLILIDADSRMGGAFDDAQALARQFIQAMGPSDLVDVMIFNDRQVVEDSKWLPAAKKGEAVNLIQSVDGTYRSQGRNRSLLTIVRSAATDGFGALGNVGEGVEVPLHQAMIVLSSGYGGADPSSTGPGAAQLSKYLTGGRFPEDNTALPKLPVPVISVYFPPKTIDEYKQNSLEFMQNLADPEIGGFFSVMRDGQSARSAAIVDAVRTRFSKMHIVKWRVACIAPTATQSFKLMFTNVKPPILGDNSFKDVPVGIDPTTWPLDVNVQYTQQEAQRTNGIHPGSHFRVYGDFCWGGDTSRAEAYFVPVGHQLPADLSGQSPEKAKRAQQQLIAMNMKGTTVAVNDSFAEFSAPDSEKILHGSGDQAVVRLVLFDNRAARTSGVTADSVLQLKGAKAPLPILWILVGLLGVVVLALLGILLFRGGSRRRAAAPTPAPRVAGSPYPGPAPLVGGAALSVADPGGNSPQPLTPGPVGNAPPAAPPPEAPREVSEVTLEGTIGSFTVLPGVEMRVGRDPSHCGIFLQDPQVSAIHASVKIEGGQFWVRDEGSTGGTMVNGHGILRGAWTPVQAGAKIAFGPVELVAMFS